MRTRAVLLALALVAAACTSTSDPTADAAPATKMLVEPSDEPGSSEIPEGVAFKANDPESPDDAPTDSASATDPVASNDNDLESEAPADADETDDSTSDPSPTTTSAPVTEFDRLVNELIGFVQQERGYTFVERPTIELLGSSDFADAWAEIIASDVAENGADYTNYTDIYRAMGVIEGDQTLAEIWQRFGGAGVIGFYDPKTGGIKLRSGEVTAFTESVLVHELVHALEDQIFDLDRPEYADANDEREWTFSALTEGSARRIETEYRKTFSTEKRSQEDAARRAIPRSVSLTEFTPAFLELQFGRYRHGESFATALWNDDGKSGLDAALKEPPRTSEAVFDPTGFMAGSISSESVRNPPADGEVFESGVWGQAGWAALLGDDVAEGWNGDSFVAWRQSGVSCVRAHLEGDSADDLDEYAEALEEWATFASGREIFYPSADVIRVTACG